MRKNSLLVGVILTLFCTMSSAQAEEGLGVKVQSGSVNSSSEGLTVPSTSPLGIIGRCQYLGETSATGLMEYQYGGMALAGPTTTAAPEYIVVTCTLISPSLGLPGERPTLTASFSTSCPGATCADSATVEGWPLRPVVICVDGYVGYGWYAEDLHIVHACGNSAL